ncbi:MAG: hypothetical protein AAB525_02465 [Patescibacteria group bacterium]
MLILTDSFFKRELKPLGKYFTVADIKKAVLKINKSAIYFSDLGYKNGKLLKLRMVNKVAGRLIVYIFTQKDIVAPLVLRLKKDKIFGENLSLNNKRGKALILKMLDLVMNDIKLGHYQKETII